MSVMSSRTFTQVIAASFFWACGPQGTNNASNTKGAVQASHLGENLIYGCTAVGGVTVGCSFRSAQIAPRQLQMMDFAISYKYTCAGHTLDLGFTLGQDSPSQVVPLHLPYNAGSGTLHLNGFGPLLSQNFSPSQLERAAVSTDCVFSVTDVKITEYVTVAMLNADLSQIALQVQPWSKVYTKALILNGAYIGDQSIALCSLDHLVAGLERVFAARGVQDVIAAGGEPVKSILSEAAKAANDTGVIAIGAKTPVEFLLANYATPETGIRDLARARCARTTIDNLIPNDVNCHSSFGCMQNVKDFAEAASNLKALRTKAQSDYTKLQKLTPGMSEQDWYLVLSSLKLD